MAVPRPRAPSALVDLVSSSDDEDEVTFQPRPAALRHARPTVFEFIAADRARGIAPDSAAIDDARIDADMHNFFHIDDSDDNTDHFHTPAQTPPIEPQAGEWVDIDGERIWIPDDIPRQPTPPLPVLAHEAIAEEIIPVDEDFTADACLSYVLAIFPDVNHEHVNSLYHKLNQEAGANITGRLRVERIVDDLISADEYPKQPKGKQADLKRKREDEEEQSSSKRWEGPNRRATPSCFKQQISAILKADFPEIPQATIKQHLTAHKHLFQTYVALANTKDSSSRDKQWRGRASTLADAATIAANSGDPDLSQELLDARSRVSGVRRQRAADDAKKRAEAENLQRAIQTGETAECQACFDDLPMNRQIHCSGHVAHFTCFECATSYIKAEVGEARCRVLCTAGCGANYAHAQLHLLEDKPLLARLETLQQEKDIRDAGLDDLEECPFCDYKAILPPIDQDFEFRCGNPACEKISCRRCKSVSHIPLSCEEHAKDNKLSVRHKIEEAMTAALMRHCNGCKKQFIKEYGCNKMSCPSCSHLQCYVCSQTIKDYNHFDQGPGRPDQAAAGSSSKKCPLYDNVEERHEREVKEAEEKTRRQIIEDNPHLSAKDLEIKLSETVIKATQDRIRNAGGVANVPAFGAYPGLFFADGDEDADPDADNDREAFDREAPNVRRDARQHGDVAGPQRGAHNEVQIAQRLGGRMLDQAAGGLYDQYRPQPVAARGNLRPREVNPGLGGHLAGHGVQPHLAMPRRMNQGLAHPRPPNMQLAGYFPVFGLPQPAPEIHAPVLGRHQQAHVAGPAVARVVPAFEDNNAPGQVVGSRNDGLGVPPDLFDPFTEDPFAGGDPDPFGFARLDHVPRYLEMMAPGQPRNHALGLNAGPENQTLYEDALQHVAQQRRRQALHNMQRRAGGTGHVHELAPGDPRHHHRGP